MDLHEWQIALRRQVGAEGGFRLQDLGFAGAAGR